MWNFGIHFFVYAIVLCCSARINYTSTFSLLIYDLLLLSFHFLISNLNKFVLAPKESELRFMRFHIFLIGVGKVCLKII